MFEDWGMDERDILTADELRAVCYLRNTLDFDAMSQPIFWEKLVARYLGGNTTAHKVAHDVEADIWGRTCRAEVKYSRVYYAKYNGIRGKDWSRDVFKWALPRGNSGKTGVDVIFLIGRERDGKVYAWLVPIADVNVDCASITLTTPRARTVGTYSWWDAYAVPFDNLLPAFACLCHNRYDAPTRAAGIRQRARIALGVPDLMEAPDA